MCDDDKPARALRCVYERTYICFHPKSTIAFSPGQLLEWVPYTKRIYTVG